MRAKFSLAKSHDGKMCTTYAAYSKQMNWIVNTVNETLLNMLNISLAVYSI